MSRMNAIVSGACRDLPFTMPISAILHRLQLTEVSRQQIEEELCLVNKEKSDIIEQFQHVGVYLARRSRDAMFSLS